jgi:MraZ protein
MELPETEQPIFTGEFRHAMDAKNRVTIPARWRRGEIDEFFAIPNLEGGFLMLMPPGEFKRLAEKVEQDESLTPADRRRFIRHFSSRAQHVTSDKQGRMVLPDEQCKVLNLRNEVVLVGNYSRFEIWSPEVWQRTMEAEAPTFSYMLGRVGI